jgi:hypothetical protein
MATTYVPAEPGPYADVDTEDLIDVLERQYEQGDPLDPAVVFELVGRLPDPPDD